MERPPHGSIKLHVHLSLVCIQSQHKLISIFDEWSIKLIRPLYSTQQLPNLLHILDTPNLKWSWFFWSTLFFFTIYYSRVSKNTHHNDNRDLTQWHYHTSTIVVIFFKGPPFMCLTTILNLCSICIQSVLKFTLKCAQL